MSLLKCPVCHLPVRMNLRCSHGGTPYCLEERRRTAEQTAEKSLGVAKAALDAVHECRGKALELIEQAKRLQRALKIEKEACAKIRAVLRPDALGCLPGSAPMVALEWCRDYDARLAAEATKCRECGLTVVECEDGKTRGAIKCCPDCGHGAVADAKPPESLK